MMTIPFGKPVRLRLSRAKGFNLQAWSREVNGLPAINVARPAVWGNEWKVGVWSNPLGRKVETLEEAVALYRRLSWKKQHQAAWVRERLAGVNVACWCCLDAPWCHGDVLLELASAP